MMFFVIAAFAELVGFFLYAAVFPKVQAVKQFRISAQQQGALTVKDDLAAAGVQTVHVRIHITLASGLSHHVNPCQTRLLQVLKS